jgi:phospholipase/carboxylesterase
VAIARRFASLPEHRSSAAIHLLHGGADSVMPAALAQAAQTRLLELGTEATLDLAPGIEHEPHPLLVAHLATRLAST